MESKYSCLIVDDEYPAHNVIKTLLLPFSSLEFVKSCYNGEDAIEEINEKFLYDIVFLDINMPIINGIELIAKLKKKPAIIITTAYTTFAFEAFENDAIDYLQKPISSERFEKAIKKALEICEKRRLDTVKTITLKIDGIYTSVNQLDIIYIRSMENYCKFYLKNKTAPVLLNEPLHKQLEKLDASLLLQIHRTCIVNKLYITQKKGNVLELNNDIKLPIGRNYQINFSKNTTQNI